MTAAVISFTAQGGRIAARIAEALPECGVQVYALPRFAQENGQIPVDEGLAAWCRQRWQDCRLLIFVGASGIAVRLIAPCLGSKAEDPAVLVVDERETFVISLVSGHLGGGNRFASLLADRLGAVPVITTATDVEGKFAVDLWAKQNHLQLSSLPLAKDVSAAILAGERIPLAVDETVEIQGRIPPELRLISMEEAERCDDLMIVISVCKWPVHHRRILFLIPQSVTLGMGCRRGKESEVVLWQAEHFLSAAGVFAQSVRQLASVDRKREEPALLALAERMEIPFVTAPTEVLAEVPGAFSSSAFVEETVGVDNVCERAAVWGSGGGLLLMPKQSGSGVTAAAAAERTVVRFAEPGRREEAER